MIKDKVIILFSIITLAIGITGCTLDSSKKESSSESIMESFEKMVFNEEGSIYEVVDFVDKNLPKIDNIEMSSSMVNTFIYSIYENMEMYTNVVYSLQNSLMDLEEILGVDKIDNSMYSDIPNEYKIIKATLKELDNSFLQLIKSNNVYLVDVDMQKIKDKYYSYINDDTIDYLEFRISESDIEVYNMNSDEYDIAQLLKMINNICYNLENMKGESQKQNWVQHLEYYLEILISKTHTTFLENDSIMSKDKFDLIKKESTKYTETNFGKFLNKYLELLSNNNYDINSAEVNEYIDDVYEKLDEFLIDNK